MTLGTYSPLWDSIKSIKREWQALLRGSDPPQLLTAGKGQPDGPVPFPGHRGPPRPRPSPHLAREPPPRPLPPHTQPRSASRPLPAPPRSPARPPPHRAGTAAAGASSPHGRARQTPPPLLPSWKRARLQPRRDVQHREHGAATSALTHRGCLLLSREARARRSAERVLGTR